MLKLGFEVAQSSVAKYMVKRRGPTARPHMCLGCLVAMNAGDGAAENSHRPTRRRECKMQGFESAGSGQRFPSVHAATYNTFNVQRHLISAKTHRQIAIK
jgi:hypothetical protein